MLCNSTLPYVQVPKGYYNDYKNLSKQGERSVTNDSNELKRILYWTAGYYDRKNMLFGFGQEPFIEASCQVTNCWVIDDRSELYQSDAMCNHHAVMHIVDCKTDDLPFYIFEVLIKERYKPAFNSVEITDNYFIWMMTHRRDDSGIYIDAPYNALRRKGEITVQTIIDRRGPPIKFFFFNENDLPFFGND